MKYQNNNQKYQKKKLFKKMMNRINFKLSQSLKKISLRKNCNKIFNISPNNNYKNLYQPKDPKKMKNFKKIYQSIKIKISIRMNKNK